MSPECNSALSLWDVFAYLARNAIPRHLDAMDGITGQPYSAED